MNNYKHSHVLKLGNASKVTTQFFLITQLMNTTEKKASIYPFSEGEDYFTIEKGQIIQSCWDSVSEEMHDENPNKIYYKSEDDAITGLNYQPTEGEIFARKCSITGEGMNEGYFSDGLDKYFKYQADAIRELRKEYPTETAEMTDKNVMVWAYEAMDIIYWTEWEDKDDFAYKIINGVLTEIL